MDSGFLPAHYETTPRQNYYISLLALSEVREGVDLPEQRAEAGLVGGGGEGGGLVQGK